MIQPETSQILNRCSNAKSSHTRLGPTIDAALTAGSNASKVSVDMAKRLLAVLAVGTLLLFGFSDCLSPMTLDQKGMQCCGSMPCTPANHSQGCCKHMMSSETPSMLPAGGVSLHVPVVAAVEYPRMLAIVLQTPTPPIIVDTHQHSPPDLYTVHASLLI